MKDKLKGLKCKKSLKRILIILAILIMAVVISCVFFNIKVDFEVDINEDVISFISNATTLNIIDVFTNIIYTISAIVNISIVVHFYKKGYKNDDKRIYREEKIFWFRDIVLKKNWSNIDSYFDNLIEQNNDLGELKNTSDTTKLKEILHKYTKQKTNIQDTFIDFMMFFDRDFSLRIKKLLEDFQDEYSILISDYIVKGTVEFGQIDELVDNHKTNFYKVIYEYERDIICKS